MNFKEYILPLILYLVTPLVLENIGFSEYAYPAKVLIVGICLISFWKSYNLNFKKSRLLISILIAALIFILWILIEQFMPYSSEFSPSTLNIAFKLLGGILVAPLVEELFTRAFLLRFLIDPDNWEKIKPKFTWFSFIITVAFFGFSHNRWLAGLLVGIILNAVYIKTKRIENCIIAHAVTNAALAAYVIVTGSWNFW